MKEQHPLPITATMAKTEPNYGTTAGLLLTACRGFFENEENERAFQVWKAGKEAKGHEKAI